MAFRYHLLSFHQLSKHWVRLLFSLFLISAAADSTSHSKSVPINPHSPLNPLNRQFGLLGPNDGPVRIVEFQKDLYPTVVSGQHSHNGQRATVTHIKATVLTILVVGTLFNALIFEPSRNAWTLFSVVLGFYYLEAYFCSTRRYISNMSEPSKVMKQVDTVRAQAPSAWGDLECYHYRRLYHSSKRTLENEKIVTHRARQLFRFKNWRDTTSIDELIGCLQYNPLRPFVKVTFVKLLAFADDDTYLSYFNQQSLFLNQERNRDFFLDTSTSLEFARFLPKMLAVRTIYNAPTGIVRMAIYWMFTGMLLTVPYRAWFSRKCDEVTVVMKKEVLC